MTTVQAHGPSARKFGWHHAALIAICALAAVLYVWGIGDTWGNTYYTAAVKSMSANLENFFFGSFDPAGIVTVDKPPLAFWVQVLSVTIFGYTKFAVLFPQVVAGVAAVFLLHRTVRRWAGEYPALLAALVMALTPITVVINRDNNPDTLLVLLLVAAAYAVTRAIDAERSSKATSWLLLGSFLVGCGFLTKMMQAWTVVPAFLLAYLVGRKASWARRLIDLGAAAAALLVSSFWWVVATSLWPSPKPYIGGSTDGSAMDLVFGYNGFGRILGRGRTLGGGRPQPSGMPAGMPGFGGNRGGFSGQPGLSRMFSEQVGGQISWLLPLCLLILAAMAVVGIQRWRGGHPAGHKQVAGWVLWGSWLLVIALTLSFAQGNMHPYYTTTLAPAIGAITGAGIMRFWHWYRQPENRAWLLLPAGVAVTTAWAVVLVARDLNWHGWVIYFVAPLGVLCIVTLIAERNRSFTKAGLAMTIVTILLVPGVWSAAGAFGGQTTGMSGSNPLAGPPMNMERFAGALPPGAMQGTRGGMRMGARDSLTEQQRKTLAYVTANAGDRQIPLAIDGGAMAASAYIMNSATTVIGMGGFSGSDDAPSVAQLTQWKQSGQIGFVLLGGSPEGFGGRDRPNGQRSPGGFPGPGGRGGATSKHRSDWVKQNCTLVDPAKYGSAAGAQELYSCL